MLRGQKLYDDVIRYINTLPLTGDQMEGIIVRMDRFVEYNYERITIKGDKEWKRKLRI